jgi:Phage tail protein
MLNLVEVRTDRGLLLSLPLFEQNEGFLVKDIQGLDPVDATLVYSSMASQDDEQEQSSKRVKRNIVVKLGYDPDYINDSVKALRDRLYGFFMPKAQVSLRFYSDDMPTVEIVGRVEKFSAPLFSRDPEATISILCAKSSFVGMDVISLAGNTTAGTTETPEEYEGTIETGGLFRLLPNRTMSGFTIYNRLADDSVQSQDFVFPLLSGDVLEINSVNLNKSARLTRTGVTTSVLYGISPYSKWLNLFPGENNLRVLAAGAAVPWTFDYTNKYGGL